MRGQQLLRMGILPAVLLITLSVSAPSSAAGTRTFPNEISLSAGLARFGPDDVTDGSSTGQGGLRFDRYLREDIFLGMLADLAMVYCPVCDETPHDFLGTVALVGGTRFGARPFSLQLGAGVGLAKVENEILRGGDKDIGSYTTVDFPLLAKAGLARDFVSLGFGLGIGLEAKYHLNPRNPAFGLACPLTVAF